MRKGRIGFDAQGFVKETDGVNILPLVGQSKTQIVEGRKTPVWDLPGTAQQKKS